MRSSERVDLRWRRCRGAEAHGLDSRESTKSIGNPVQTLRKSRADLGYFARMNTRVLLAFFGLLAPALLFAQDWQLCLDWNAVENMQDPRIQLGWQGADGTHQGRYAVEVAQEVPEEAALTLAFPPSWKAFVVIWNGDSLEVAPMHQAQQLDLSGRWQAGTNTLEVLCDGVVATGLTPRVFERNLELTRAEFREDGLYLTVTNNGTQKIKGATATLGCQTGGRRVEISEVVSLKPGKRHEIYFPSGPDVIERDQAAPFSIRLPDGREYFTHLSFMKDWPLTVDQGELRCGPDRMRIHALELSIWPGAGELNLRKAWEEALEKWTQIGGNAVSYCDQAPEALLRLAEDYGVMVFEQANHRPAPAYVQDHPCLVGSYDWTSGQVKLYGSNQTMTTIYQERGQEAWLWGGIKPPIAPGWGGWLKDWKSWEQDPHFCGSFFRWDRVHRGELWNAEGTFLPAVNELKSAFGKYEMRMQIADVSGEDDLLIRRKWGSAETGPLELRLRVTGEDGIRELGSLALDQGLGEQWYSLGEWFSAVGTEHQAALQAGGAFDFQLLKLPGAGSPLVYECYRGQPLGMLGMKLKPEAPKPASELAWERDGDNYVFEADAVTYTVSMQSGLPVAITTADGNLMPLPCEWTFDRFPLPGEDRMMSDEDARFWAVAGNRMSVLFAEVDGATLSLGGDFMEERGFFKVSYTVDVEGQLRMESALEFGHGHDYPVRIGVRMYGDAGMHNLKWLGYGPLENYSDRGAGTYWGSHTASDETLLLAPYDVVQASGVVHRVDHVAWTHGSGWTLNWSNNLPRSFGFSALPYLPQMQVAGQPWAKDAAIPVITLNAFNAPLSEPNNPYRECTWSWTLNVTPSGR